MQEENWALGTKTDCEKLTVTEKIYVVFCSFLFFWGAKQHFIFNNLISVTLGNQGQSHHYSTCVYIEREKNLIMKRHVNNGEKCLQQIPPSETQTVCLYSQVTLG